MLCCYGDNKANWLSAILRCLCVWECDVSWALSHMIDAPEENCQCCRVSLPHFTMISCTRTIIATYWLSCYVAHSLLALILEYIHVLSFTVLKEIKLEWLEPLHWLILWEWTRAWKHWSKYQDLKGKGYKHMWVFSKLCCYGDNKANWLAAILRCLCVRMWCELRALNHMVSRDVSFPLEAHILVSLASLVMIIPIYSQVCSCLIIIHCSLRDNDLTDTGALTLARALQDNKSLEELKWVVNCLMSWRELSVL